MLKLAYRKRWLAVSRTPAFAALVVIATMPAMSADYVPARGFVPDADTAVVIAEAVLSPLYGRTQIRQERPFHARLVKGVWIVSGSLPPGRLGGVAVVRMAKRDGRILFVTHGK